MHQEVNQFERNKIRNKVRLICNWNNPIIGPRSTDNPVIIIK